MNSTFRDNYKIKKTAVDISNETQICLSNNQEYDKMTDELCISIYNYFIETYPNIKIDVPRKRIKSVKSICEKSKSKEIERLSKLYAIDGIDEEETEELYELIKERIQEKQQIYEKEVLHKIKELLENDIEQFNIEEFLQYVMIDQNSANTKKALLRILMSKIEKSNRKDKRQKIKMLDEKYGEKAAKRSGKPEDNIIQYETIEAIRADENRKRLLYNKVGYLKSEDLMATKIVITDTNYNDKEMKKLATDFIKKITQDEQFLQENGIEIIPFSLKHKKKTNGYEAEHLKFRFKNNPEYTLEFQIKSQYVENLCRGKGEASHENRPGKERILPEIENKENFRKQVKNNVPRYNMFYQENGRFVRSRKCSTLENVISYYIDEMSLDEYPQLYNEICECLKEKETEKMS